MASYLNPSSTASAGTAIGKDPDARGGLRERARIVGGVHRLLSGGVAQDYTGTLRRWQLRWTGLTNAQWAVIKSYIQGGYQLYWQGPEMSAKVAVILEDVEQDQVHLNGDSAAAPHWNVSLTLREGTLANAVQYVYGAASITLGAVTLSSAGTVVNILVFDQFTDADTTALTSHTISPNNSPATSWTVPEGGTTIVSNRAKHTTFAGGSYDVAGHCNPGVSDCTLNVTTQIPSNFFMGGICARFSDTSNFWVIGAQAADNWFRIVEYNAGVVTTRATTAKTISTATDYAIAAVLSGTSISATIDGGSPISYASAALNQTATKHGLVCSVGNVQWDDFKVIA